MRAGGRGSGVIESEARLSDARATTPHARLAAALAARWGESKASALVTWLNHYSAQVVVASGTSLTGFDYVGIDGKLLQYLVKVPHRTSADLVVPLVLASCPGARVAIIGGVAEADDERRRAISRLLGSQSTIVASLHGYADRETFSRFADELASLGCNLVLVGMGAATQEQHAMRLQAALPHGLIMTCGGYLDQLVLGDYYPRWAYPLRLNWAVRLAKEPRRLWRRYTTHAICAVRNSRRLANFIHPLPGYRQAVDASSGSHRNRE